MRHSHNSRDRDDHSSRAPHHNHDSLRRHGPHPGGRGVEFARFGPGRGRRSKRGDVRAAVLLLLDEQPRNGYQLIQEIDERSHGAWRPSPGSIYPVLSQLEDEGLIVASGDESGRSFTLSAKGRSTVTENRDTFGSPWDAAAAAVGEPRFDLVRSMRQVMSASRQVLEAGSDDQATKVSEILKDARRRIYGILAEEEES